MGHFPAMQSFFQIGVLLPQESGFEAPPLKMEHEVLLHRYGKPKEMCSSELPLPGEGR
jgi:hypothetical protein